MKKYLREVIFDQSNQPPLILSHSGEQLRCFLLRPIGFRRHTNYDGSITFEGENSFRFRFLTLVNWSNNRYWICLGTIFGANYWFRRKYQFHLEKKWYHWWRNSGFQKWYAFFGGQNIGYKSKFYVLSGRISVLIK